MTTKFYIRYEIRKSNGAFVWFSTKKFDAEAEARALYEIKMATPNVMTAHLMKEMHYDADELIPRCAERFPDGVNDWRILSMYSRI